MSPTNARRLRDYGIAAGLFAAVLFIGRFEQTSTTATAPQDVLGFAPQEASEPIYPARTLVDTDASTDGEKGGLSYAAFNTERERRNIESFHGFGCLGSCDGHEAGYQWAEDNGIGDTADCDGNSWSFEEGCAAYAIENPAEIDPDDAPDPSPI